MFVRFQKLYEAAGEGGAGGAGAGGEGAGDAAAVAAAAAATAAAASAAAGGQGSSMTDAEAKLLKEVMEKKAKIKESEELTKSLTEKLKVWEGLDPEQVKALVQKAKDAETRDLEKKGEFDKVKAQIIEAHNAEKLTLQQQIDKMSGDLKGRDTVIDGLTVGQAFATSKFINEKLVLTPAKTRVLYGDHFDRDESGRVVGYDKPRGTASRAPLVDAQGEPLAFDLALTKLVEADADKDTLLRASLKAGAGSDTSGSRAGASGKGEELTGIQRIAASIASGGLQGAKKLRLS